MVNESPNSEKIVMEYYSLLQWLNFSYANETQFVHFTLIVFASLRVYIVSHFNKKFERRQKRTKLIIKWIKEGN